MNFLLLPSLFDVVKRQNNKNLLIRAHWVPSIDFCDHFRRLQVILVSNFIKLFF